MKRRIAFAAAPLLALAVFSAAAGADPIADRQALMKDQGKAVGSLAPIAKGEKPFDAAAVLAALNKLNDDAQKIDPAKLFPVGSETGGETTASPKIWEDNAGFVAAVNKYKADATAAAAAKPQDLASFKLAFAQVSQNCGACHQTYRIKKN
ncbi:c-type cytochrome [Phyllobacterium myrsinacearum]|uniref:Cytochrome c556 n=1 Tax=Phyllobacterium myrsinacearum TaxID=28101 RepID=A0A839ECQ9_9HYPH|nr:cytochrome c [Phyllobacterium myrsinacearum]MBA8876722.1 cytochrome c556 [Phyllobacterium myrsinacearum]